MAPRNGLVRQSIKAFIDDRSGVIMASEIVAAFQSATVTRANIDQALRRMAAAGQIQRIGQGMYMSASAPLPPLLQPQPGEPTDAAKAADRKQALDLARARAVTAIYRWYDVDDVPIYYGITLHLASRQTAHAKKAAWSAFADRCQVERLPNRSAAEARERELIDQDRPVFNRVHNRTDDALRRVVEYLTKHGRSDLLNIRLPARPLMG